MTVRRPVRAPERRDRSRSGTGFVAAVTAAESAVLFGLAAVVSIGDRPRTTVGFGVLAVGAAVAARIGLRRTRPPAKTLTTRLLAMVTVNWMLLAAVGAVAHMVAGATTNPAVAVFEGTAGITTTAMSALDPADLDRGLHLYRAMAQWLGGLGAIIIGIVVFPLALGPDESSARFAVRGGRRSLLAGRTTGFERAVALYGGFTTLLVVAFALAGTTGFEALVHGLTVASTGGLSTTSASVAGLGTGAEWVAAVGMALAGVSVAAAWWAVVGDVGALMRSTELRAYVVAIAVTTGVIALDTGTVRGAFALAGSAASTTGAIGSTTTESLGPGAATLLFFVGGIGAMAGSAGGGFGWIRLLHAVGFARRELIQQLHPDAIRVVKVGGRIVSEPSLARTNGYITMFTMAAGLGALLVALTDSGIGVASSVSLSVAALSTSGLQTIAPVEVAELGEPGLLALCSLMLLGRLSISAVLLTLATGVQRTAQAARRSAVADDASW